MTSCASAPPARSPRRATLLGLGLLVSSGLALIGCAQETGGGSGGTSATTSTGSQGGGGQGGGAQGGATSTGTSACLDEGKACITATDCCSAICHEKVCLALGTCLAAKDSCDGSIPCCGGVFCISDKCGGP